MKNDETIKKLNELFGSYRAEWLKDKIFQLFAKPCYFSGLEDARPCVLQGGRGSGKTTVLRGLSYQGQYALHNQDIQKFDTNVQYIGIYHRVDTNHVRTFVDGGVTEREWQRLFAHYFNLVICREILDFLQWHFEKNNTDIPLPSDACLLIAKSLHITHTTCDCFDTLLEATDYAMYNFQSCINNIVDFKEKLSLSFAGDPIKLITKYTCKLPQFNGKVFYILLDEYENFEDYQQIVVNSLLKHNTDYYTFKIGVRELGWRKKHTLNEQELLYDPADYILFNIEEKLTSGRHFEEFAKEVCQQRIEELLSSREEKKSYEIEKYLPSLDYEEEAIRLGVEKTNYIKTIKELPDHIIGLANKLPLLYQFLIGYWADCKGEKIIDMLNDYQKNPDKWNTRYGNYKYEMLFKIKQGRGSSGIPKYYAGWNTFIKLSAGNIRYLMELVYRTYEQHLVDGFDLQTMVSPETQTEVAMAIGKKNIIQLESFCKEGARLTKLLLSVGKIFGTLAKEIAPNAAEINQFTIENSREMSDRCNVLITAAVMNLALIRETGTKLGETETKDYTYSIHPIFAPFFVFSFRKKRKLVLQEEQVLGLIDYPKKYIHEILKSRNVNSSEIAQTYDQFDFFGDLQ